MKTDKSVINGIFALLSVLALLIPFGVSQYAETQTVENILIHESDYTTGTTFGLYDGSENMTELITGLNDFPFHTELGWESNNDTIFQGYESGGHDGIYFANYNTYTGSGEHTIIVNWSDVPESTYESVRYLYIPLNITTSELAEFDFVRIHSDFNKSDGADIRLVYQYSDSGLFSIYPTVLDSETDIYVLTLAGKNLMNAYPNGTVFLTFAGLDDEFVETQTTWDWMIEANALESEDMIFGSEFTDIAVFSIIVLCLDFLYIWIIVFANPVIDLKIDKGKKGKGKR